MFLAASVNSYDWYGCGGQHCSDQFDRKSWRLCWTLYRGWIKDTTQSFEAGLYFLSACAVLAAIVTMLALRSSSPSVAVQSVHHPASTG